jgi:hypothetical protein
LQQWMEGLSKITKYPVTLLDSSAEALTGFFWIQRGSSLPFRCLEAYRLRRGINTLILDLGTRWRWGISFTHRPLYPLKKTPVSFEQEDGWASYQSGLFGENFLSVLEIESRTLPSLY